MIPDNHIFDETHPIISATLWKVLHAENHTQEKDFILKGLKAAYIAGWAARGTCFQDTWINTIEDKDWSRVLKGE